MKETLIIDKIFYKFSGGKIAMCLFKDTPDMTKGETFMKRKLIFSTVSEEWREERERGHREGRREDIERRGERT